MWKRALSPSISLRAGSNSLRNAFFPFLPKFSLLSRPCSFYGVLSKVFNRDPIVGPPQIFSLTGHHGFHSGKFLEEADKDPQSSRQSESGPTAQGDHTKPKRKKLKGKRAVVRWLKHFRWKKKKEYQRMTAEEKILYRLNKARKKEARLVEALKKLEPKEWSEATHDPEVLTPEEHFYFLKMGLKCKNYVPVGRRGIYQGVILNMHLHWKKHQTLLVIVKTFTPEEVKEIAAELARLTGGIVLDIHDENTIIMYRGKNYSQPPTEIMSPRSTLPRKKALDKSQYRDALRAVRRHIPRLEQELQLLSAQIRNKEDEAVGHVENPTDNDTRDTCSASSQPSLSASSNKLKELMDQYNSTLGEDSSTEAGIDSDSEDLSDIFETESDNEDNAEKHLYLDTFDKFPPLNNGGKSLEEELHQMSLDSKGTGLSEKEADLADFDEIDQMFLRAAELLKKKRR